MSTGQHPQHPQQDHPVAIVYHLSGPATAAAVARGESTLLGAAIVSPGADPMYLPPAQLGGLSMSNGERRIHDNALTARAVEMQHRLTAAPNFDCAWTMRKLLDQRAPDDAPLASAEEAIARVVETLHLREQLSGQLATQGLCSVYNNVELPVVDPTARMILNGIGVDVDWLNPFAREQTSAVRRSKQAVQAAIGRSINLNSSPELGRLLYDDLALPQGRWTKSGQPSVSLEALEQFLTRRDVVEPLMNYVRAETLRRRAVELQRFTVANTARIHTTLDPLGAETGRYSSSQPALQNLPRPPRRAIVAPAGHVLMEADFSQIELCVLAHFSRDERLLAAFAEEQVDLHRRTAAAALGVPEGSVTDAQRQIGKRVNFAVTYGQAAEGLARDLGISTRKAQQLIHSYFNTFPRVHEWIQEASRQDVVWTLYGRRRRVSLAPELRTDDTRWLAVNTTLQGTAADIMKLALARLHAALPADARMVLTVHDSVLLEVPIDRVDEVGQHVRAIMETPPPGFTVPLRVEVSTGRTWAECKTHTTPAENDGEQAGQDHVVLEAASH